MSTSTFSVFSSIFGFVAAAISLLTVLINICRSHLPSHKIKELESLMDETETLFKKVVEDGLLIEPGLVRQTERHLTMLRTLTYHLQSRAYNATTLRQDCLEFLRGTSNSIGGACRTIRGLRTELVSTLLHHLLCLSSLIPSATLAHYFPLRFIGPVRVHQYSRDGDWIMRDMDSLKGIHSTIPCGVIRTYEQLVHNQVQQLLHTSVTLEPGA
ncbi:hypothetical protein J3R82DRAFT_7349 [Butyriboletus roseoflavus]|nr:hypothetical protein J3R82DRAFT_7349 [Butyriboletus roseoflavus]